VAEANKAPSKTTANVAKILPFMGIHLPCDLADRDPTLALNREDATCALGAIIGFAIFKNKRRDLQAMLAVVAGDLSKNPKTELLCCRHIFPPKIVFPSRSSVPSHLNVDNTPLLPCPSPPWADLYPYPLGWTQGDIGNITLSLGERVAIPVPPRNATSGLPSVITDRTTYASAFFFAGYSIFPRGDECLARCGPSH
jgi:hypothetical protein